MEMVKFSGLTLFEFTNQDKVNLFLKKNISKFISLPAPSGTDALHLDFVLEKYFLIVWLRELYGPGPRFFIIW